MIQVVSIADQTDLYGRGGLDLLTNSRRVFRRHGSGCGSCPNLDFTSYDRNNAASFPVFPLSSDPGQSEGCSWSRNRYREAFPQKIHSVVRRLSSMPRMLVRMHDPVPR